MAWQEADPLGSCSVQRKGEKTCAECFVAGTMLRLSSKCFVAGTKLQSVLLQGQSFRVFRCRDNASPLFKVFCCRVNASPLFKAFCCRDKASEYFVAGSKLRLSLSVSKCFVAGTKLHLFKVFCCRDKASE
jgi:hypothetical protein